METKKSKAPKALSPQVSKRMATVCQTGTEPELALRRVLHADGFRFRQNVRPIRALRSRADIVFPKARVAVFIDGCFWHGCPTHGTWPKHNHRWWKTKLLTNKIRDKRITRHLQDAGWTVLRIWAHEQPQDAAAAIKQALAQKVFPLARARKELC